MYYEIHYIRRSLVNSLLSECPQKILRAYKVTDEIYEEVVSVISENIRTKQTKSNNILKGESK